MTVQMLQGCYDALMDRNSKITILLSAIYKELPAGRKVRYTRPLQGTQFKGFLFPQPFPQDVDLLIGKPRIPGRLMDRCI